MSKAGEKLIASATEAGRAAKLQVDACMLRSMAVSFRLGHDFSFNGSDMADLLNRQADIVDGLIPAEFHNVLPSNGRSK
jgi:hypothetical protein